MQQSDALPDANPWQYSQRCLRLKGGNCPCTEKPHKLLQQSNRLSCFVAAV